MAALVRNEGSKMTGEEKKRTKSVVCATVRGDREMNRKLILLSGFLAIIILFYTPTAQAILTDVIFYDDTVVGSDESYNSVTVYDSTPETTTIEFYGYADYLITNDSSTVNIHGGGWIFEQYGEVPSPPIESKLYDSSTVNVYEGGGFGGGTGTFLDLYDSSTLNVHGGYISWFSGVHDSAIFNIYDGEAQSVQPYNYSTLNVYGGTMETWGNINVPSTSTVNIYGYGFYYNPEGRWCCMGDLCWWESKLTGYGL
jgi:hypothetical protein